MADHEEELRDGLVNAADSYATQISHQLEMPVMVVIMAPLSDGWWTLFGTHAYSPLNVESAILALARGQAAKLRSPDHNCKCEDCDAMATRMETVAAVIEVSGLHGTKASKQ